MYRLTLEGVGFCCEVSLLAVGISCLFLTPQTMFRVHFSSFSTSFSGSQASQKAVAALAQCRGRGFLLPWVFKIALVQCPASLVSSFPGFLAC